MMKRNTNETEQNLQSSAEQSKASSLQQDLPVTSGMQTVSAPVQAQSTWAKAPVSPLARRDVSASQKENLKSHISQAPVAFSELEQSNIEASLKHKIASVPSYEAVTSYHADSISYEQAIVPPCRPKKTPQQKHLLLLVWIAIILAALLFIYCIISDLYAYSHIETTNATMQQEPLVLQYQEKPLSDNLTTPGADGKYTIAGVAEAVSPSIVEIVVSAEESMISTGSGIILTEDGYIVTNAHVLQGGDAFWVSLYDTEQAPLAAVCIGQDTKTDLAVLKVQAEHLPAAVLGNAEKLQVGEEVVAIGNPAGLTGTVTNGIVSALHRQVRGDSTGFEMDCIQTNAAISPGNSGGALVNLYGQVVGITSSKYASVYGNSAYEGLGFAISINVAMPVIEELVSQGYVSGRVRMGITFRSLSVPEVLEEFKNQHQLKDETELSGLWVSEIAEDCDIANTQLLPDDVIYQVEGQSVTDYSDLSMILEQHKANETLTADCYRYDARGHCTRFQVQFKLMEDRSGNF